MDGATAAASGIGRDGDDNAVAFESRANTQGRLDFNMITRLRLRTVDLYPNDSNCFGRNFVNVDHRNLSKENRATTTQRVSIPSLKMFEKTKQVWHSQRS